MTVDPSANKARASRSTTPLMSDERLTKVQREAFLRSNGINPMGTMQFEIWPDDVREMPNYYARSALFTVRNKTVPRAVYQNQLIFNTDKGVKLTYTGIELRADDDELVWLQILDYAKRFPLGEPVEFNLHELCKELNWSINGRNYEKARRSISRLKATEVRIDHAKLCGGVAISLIHEYSFADDGSKGTKYKVWIHRDMIFMFAGHTSTRLVWASYRDLTPTARRLYDSIGSHKEPFPLALENFAKLGNSDCVNPYKIASKARQVCAELLAAKMVKKAWVHGKAIFCER